MTNEFYLIKNLDLPKYYLITAQEPFAIKKIIDIYNLTFYKLVGIGRLFTILAENNIELESQRLHWPGTICRKCGYHWVNISSIFTGNYNYGIIIDNCFFCSI